MNVKRFTAATTRDALRLVRDNLGPDAVILSNRTQGNVVEVLAIADEEMQQLEPVEPARISTNTLDALGGKRRKADDSVRPSGTSTTARAPAHDMAVASKAGGQSESDRHEMQRMMDEIRSMRGMLEVQLNELAWNGAVRKDPGRTLILREMLSAGFCASLARYVADKLPANMSSADALTWMQAALAHNLTVLPDETDLLDRGGVYALVGPTGVGKTTTTAKLAARCVMRHGPSKLALITTDGYRIGGYEQLRIYGKILGVMVHSVKDETDLKIALDELRGKHTILIDTVGVGQRDKMVTEQIAMLGSAGARVKRLLCLSATSTGETLNEVIRAYEGDGLAGCILTKLDEAATVGSALDVVIRHKLLLHYIANGQRVPEDLHLASSKYLIDRAFKHRSEAPAYQFKDDELGHVVAAATRHAGKLSQREVRIG